MFILVSVSNLIQGLAVFKTAAVPQFVDAQILGTLRMHGRALSVIASSSPCLGLAQILARRCELVLSLMMSKTLRSDSHASRRDFLSSFGVKQLSLS
jgi:hypothetical protein